MWLAREGGKEGGREKDKNCRFQTDCSSLWDILGPDQPGKLEGCTIAELRQRVTVSLGIVTTVPFRRVHRMQRVIQRQCSENVSLLLRFMGVRDTLADLDLCPYLNVLAAPGNPIHDCYYHHLPRIVQVLSDGVYFRAVGVSGYPASGKRCAPNSPCCVEPARQVRSDFPWCALCFQVERHSGLPDNAVSCKQDLNPFRGAVNIH